MANEEKCPICNECKNNSCSSHLLEYHQIEHNYNLFQQTIIDKENHSLIKEINQWEKISIEKIQQTAEECRNKLIDYLNQSLKFTKDKLKDLFEEFKQINKTNKYDENDLKELQEKLNKLTEEFQKAKNIFINEKISSEFISKIDVIISTIDEDTKSNIVAEGNDQDNQLDELKDICTDDENHRHVEEKSNILQQTLLTKKNINEQFIGTTNFPAKYRRTTVGLTSQWKDVAKKTGNRIDPWLELNINQYPEEIAICHDYDPTQKIWNKHEIIIKMEPTSFENGSMRECFRLKKLSVSSSNQDWNNASNCIAKRYIIDVPNTHYFDDVIMQMTAKLWGTHYNQHKPPKKIDIIQMSVLEFKNRSDQPYYHLEGFIEGSYMKYNSNSGFVCDEILRYTPQAFSHFTFEASYHQLIVIDIQGVGDIYTDPQIHTSRGTEYGEGNLGIRGMALFFHTHECNPICTGFKLTPFDLSTNERQRQVQRHLLSPTRPSSLASTVCRGSEEPLSLFSKFGSFFRSNSSQSQGYGSDDYASKTSSPLSLSLSNSQVLHRSVSVPYQEHSSTTSNEENDRLSSSMTRNISMSPPDVFSRLISEINSKVEENPNNYRIDRRPSCVTIEKEMIKEFVEKHENILGQIHHEICKCYQVGRLNELGAEEYDEASAFFHLQQAAELNVKDAVLELAKIYLDLPRKILPNYSPMDETDSFTKGLQLMLHASELRETEAHLLLAQLYDKGVDGSLEPDWDKAAEYYEKYIAIRQMEMSNLNENADENEINPNDSVDNGVSFNDQHDIVARLATLYKTGDDKLECDYRRAGDLFNKAAEMATAAMKGRLANKYFQAAEEAYALEPDEEN